MLSNNLGNVDGIALGIDIETELEYLDGSFDDSNDGKLEVFLLGVSLVSDRIQDSLWNKSSILIYYIELRTRFNQFGIFGEHEN